MKTILLIVGVFAAATANPVPEDDFNEISVKQLAASILSIVEGLKNDLSEVTHLADEIEPSIPAAVNKVPSIVNQNPQIVNIKQGLEVAEILGRDVKKCQKVFDEKVKKLIADLKNQVKTTAKESLQAVKESFEFFKEEQDKIETALGENLEQELKLCNESPEKCRITGEFLNDTDVQFSFLDTLRPRVKNLLRNILSKVENHTVDERSLKEVFEPVNKCLAGKN